MTIFSAGGCNPYLPNSNAIVTLDIEQSAQLLAYLRQTQRIEAHESPQLHALSGGVSNRTILLQRPNGEAWVLKQALQKLRVAVDWFSAPERVHQEALGLQWLERLLPADRVPQLIFEDRAHHLLAMTAVAEPHSNWKTLLLNGQLQLDHVEQFGQLLGILHRQGYVHRADTAKLFADRTFFETLRLEPYYSYTATQRPQAKLFIEALIQHTRAQSLTLVHGDYSPKNVLIHDNHLVLLDHEVIHFGDPGFDIGFALTHLLSKAHHLPQHRAAFATAAQHFWQTYLDTLGQLPWATELEARAVHHTLACLLARVAGRSPLEYLLPSEQAKQRDNVVKLMSQPPDRITDLIHHFIDELNL